MSQDKPKRIAYRTITVEDLHQMLNKYDKLSSWETACKLMLNEKLNIMRPTDENVDDLLNDLKKGLSGGNQTTKE